MDTPTIITTIDELASTHGAILQKETDDRAGLLSMFQPDADTIKSKLVMWAAQGFPVYWTLSELQVNPPSVCSDGIVRGFFDYAQYLLGGTLDTHVDALTTQVPGAKFNFFLRDVNTVGLNVKRAQ